jgi:hypothetical protein
MPDLSGLPVTRGQERGDLNVVQALLAEGDIVTFGHTTFKVVNGELRDHNDEGNDTPGT